MNCPESKYLHADVDVAVISRTLHPWWILSSQNDHRFPKELDIPGKCWPGRVIMFFNCDNGRPRKLATNLSNAEIRQFSSYILSLYIVTLAYKNALDIRLAITCVFHGGRANWWVWTAWAEWGDSTVKLNTAAWCTGSTLHCSTSWLISKPLSPAAKVFAWGENRKSNSNKAQ